MDFGKWSDYFSVIIILGMNTNVRQFSLPE